LGDTRLHLTLAQRLPAGVYSLAVARDGEQALRFVNDRWLAMCGLERDAVMADPSLAFQAIHPDDRPGLVEAHAATGDACQPLRWEGRLQVRGEITWVVIESSPRREPHGRVIWEGVMMAMSPRPAIAEPPRTGEVRFGKLLEHLPVAIALVSLGQDEEIVYVNAAFERVFGYAREQIPTVERWAELAYPDPEYRYQTFRAWNASLSEALAGDGHVASREVRVRRKDGKMLDVLAGASVWDEMLMVSLVDITERRETELALQTAREQLERTAYELTENIPVGTYTMVLKPDDPLGKFSFMSTRFLELTGLERAEAESDPMKGFACVHPDDFDAWVQLNLEAFANKAPFFGETRVVVDGQVRWITAESIPRNLPDGTTVWEGVLADITRQKDAEAALCKAHADLLAAETERSRMEERRRLLRDVHDGFGSQLATARLQLAHGRVSTAEASDLLQECLDDMRLVVDTLDAEDSDLATTLANYRYRMQGRLEQSPVRVAWQVDLAASPSLDARVILQIMRILQEALNNALNHARANRVDIVVAAPVAGCIQLSVADDGIGLTEDQVIPGRGLRNMRQRSTEIGGRLQLDALNPGTRVSLRVPIPQDA